MSLVRAHCTTIVECNVTTPARAFNTTLRRHHRWEEHTRIYKTAFVLTGYLPRAPPPSNPQPEGAQSVPPVPPGPVWLHVCGPTWLVQGPSVPVEAAMAADNANWLPVITANCSTARNWADTLGGVCLRSVCSFSVCAQQVKVFPDLVKELFVSIFQLVTSVHQ